MSNSSSRWKKKTEGSTSGSSSGSAEPDADGRTGGLAHRVRTRSVPDAVLGGLGVPVRRLELLSGGGGRPADRSAATPVSGPGLFPGPAPESASDATGSVPAPVASGSVRLLASSLSSVQRRHQTCYSSRLQYRITCHSCTRCKRSTAF